MEVSAGAAALDLGDVNTGAVVTGGRADAVDLVARSFVVDERARTPTRNDRRGTKATTWVIAVDRCPVTTFDETRMTMETAGMTLSPGAAEAK